MAYFLRSGPFPALVLSSCFDLHILLPVYVLHYSADLFCRKYRSRRSLHAEAVSRKPSFRLTAAKRCFQQFS